MSTIYEDATTWEADTYGALRRSRSRAWIVAGISSVLSALSIVAVVLLVPLKEAVPYVIQQDTETASLRVVRPVAPGPLTQDKALAQYHLVQYVNAREGYDRGSIQESINLVYVLSTPSVRDALGQTLTDGHPENPVVLYGDRATVDVNVSSVSFLNDATASVRFVTETREATRTTRTHYVAIIGFRYVQSPASQEVLFQNPLGFQVTTYRRSLEVLPNGS